VYVEVSSIMGFGWAMSRVCLGSLFLWKTLLCLGVRWVDRWAGSLDKGGIDFYEGRVSI
jgi:hypothetical protein